MKPVLLAAALCAAPLLVAYAQADHHAGMDGIETVQIGGLFSLTGEASSIGDHIQAAGELAAEDFNAYLAERGAAWRLKLAVEDTETNPVRSLEKFQSLHAKGVGIVIGPFASASVQNIKGYSDSNDLLIVSPGSTSPALAIPGDSVYRMVPDDNNQGKVLGRMLEERGMEALVPMWRGEIYGDGLKDAAAESFASRGGAVHDGVRYNPESPDLSLEVSALADRVREAADMYGADGVAVLLISFDEAVQIVQSASEYDALRGVWWVGAESVARQPEFITDAISFEFVTSADLTAVEIMVSPGVRHEDVRMRLAERIGAEPNAFAYFTYDSVWVVGRAIMEAGPDPAAVKAVMLDVAASHEGTLSSNELNEAGDLALANYDILSIVDGAWTVTGQYFAEDDALVPASDAVVVDGTEFAPEYEINGGEVVSMFTDPQENVLVVEIDADDHGDLSIDLPRTLIESRPDGAADDRFMVLVDGSEREYDEVRTSEDSRTITVGFEAGSERIEIVGTRVAVPEFGAVAALALAASVASVVALLARSRLAMPLRV